MKLSYRFVVPLLIGLSPVGHSLAALDDAAADAALKAGGCKACHALDKKMLGPSIQDIAAKYAATPDAAPYLIGKVRAGSQGVWGKIPMMPMSNKIIGDEDLAGIIDWMLTR